MVPPSEINLQVKHNLISCKQWPRRIIPSVSLDVHLFLAAWRYLYHFKYLMTSDASTSPSATVLWRLDMCRMHSHAGLLQVGPCFLGLNPFIICLSLINCMCSYFSYLILSLEFAVSCLVSLFPYETLFLVLDMLPIPHFLLFHLVWLWGLGWCDNRGDRPVSILFAKFLLLQAYCTFAGGTGKSLALPSPTHTLSETCKREWVLRNLDAISVFLYSTQKILDLPDSTVEGNAASATNISQPRHL